MARKKGSKKKGTKKGRKKGGKKSSTSALVKDVQQLKKDMGHTKALLTRAINHNRRLHGKKELSIEKAWKLPANEALSFRREKGNNKQLGPG